MPVGPGNVVPPSDNPLAAKSQQMQAAQSQWKCPRCQSRNVKIYYSPTDPTAPPTIVCGQPGCSLAPADSHPNFQD
jgi:hypothetical protein